MLDQKLKKRTMHRAKIIRGQMDGLIKALDREDYCPTILEQSRSIQQSLKSLESFILENHLKTHVSHQMQDNKNKAVGELIKIYTLANK